MSSRLHGNAMVNDDGAVFQPATVEDARRIEAEHGARIAAPDRWPWPCAEVETFTEGVDWGGAAPRHHTQCRRVAGHSGEHRAEIGWEA
jgi:hypothetical protein